MFRISEKTDEDSDETEEADEDDEEEYGQLEACSSLSERDQYCVNVWLNFVDMLNNGLPVSILNGWRLYGITTTIENVLIPLLEQNMLSEATLAVFYELTTEIQQGRYSSCGQMFSKLAGSADFAHVTTFFPALKRAVAIAAAAASSGSNTLPSSRNNS
ncbi:hypothetical protein L596_004889 [Steinernema carpocapsae]|uniref:Uncharacterized protein n=1 Tax=Steinernema carpocapsae TaxID=34508 RepID=A0A4U8UX89_STECR|nr:hypothetical protein L596_004889 [Steinernema carpocapsae]